MIVSKDLGKGIDINLFLMFICDFILTLFSYLNFELYLIYIVIITKLIVLYVAYRKYKSLDLILLIFILLTMSLIRGIDSTFQLFLNPNIYTLLYLLNHSIFLSILIKKVTSSEHINKSNQLLFCLFMILLLCAITLNAFLLVNIVYFVLEFTLISRIGYENYLNA